MSCQVSVFVRLNWTDLQGLVYQEVKLDNMQPKPGDSVVVTALPAGFLDDLPREDQQAITAGIGKPILLKEYDEAGRAELELTDDKGVIHFIYVDPSLIRNLTADETCEAGKG